MLKIAVREHVDKILYSFVGKNFYVLKMLTNIFHYICLKKFLEMFLIKGKVNGNVSN